MQCSAVKSVRTSIQETPNNSSTSEWHNIGEPALQVKTQQCTYISRKRDTLTRTVMYTFWTEKTDGLREESRKPSMLNWKTNL